MNARASQPELPKSAETFSGGAESFASRSAEVAESVNAKQAQIVVAPSMGGQGHHDGARQSSGEERLTQRDSFKRASGRSRPGSLFESAAGRLQPGSRFESVSGLPARSFESVSDIPSQSVWSRIPFCLVGLLLTVTAIAKLWMLLTDSFADIRVGLPKEILWLSVAFEFWLAYENFRLRDHRDGFCEYVGICLVCDLCIGSPRYGLQFLRLFRQSGSSRLGFHSDRCGNCRLVLRFNRQPKSGRQRFSPIGSGL